MKLKMSVGTFREAGLEAKWGKTRLGRPCMFVRNPNAHHEHQRVTWWLVTADMWSEMEAHGIVAGFDTCTLIADIFSIPATANR